ncbi:MAG: DUF1211 domain-containing protein [Chitinophagaceae bacterium]|nr:DUF1211 domain-containing protein [Chitinophagaceae bacterium]
MPVFDSYVLSFIFVGIYWGNHHHLLHATRQRNCIRIRSYRDIVGHICNRRGNVADT